MFSGDVLISRRVLTEEDVRKRIECEKILYCFNSSHVDSVEALRKRFEIGTLPENPPKIKLRRGNSIIVCTACFKRRLKEGDRYSEEEKNSVKFKFTEYIVLKHNI